MNQPHQDPKNASENNNSADGSTNEEKKELTLGQIMLSTLQAAVGIQSGKNRERDFTRGNIKHFIISGILFTAAFVLLLVLMVNLIL